MRKSNPQSAFPILIIAVFIMVFGGGLFAAIINLIIKELTSTNISRLHSVVRESMLRPIRLWMTATGDTGCHTRCTGPSCRISVNLGWM